ncbi:adenylosuccinate synthase [Acutalibacter muris]|jgi:adenylosuccinate synthase|uniref:Adenylosuccinate synthetase n=1 Tax=Acutalibacter muris TaxID=1796620 RepID=A0A1Z2XTA0_9FIRM|nr:adenylosuccinate synthase [Acutalibacter muris]ANU55090.1 adenylosuccinate synthase [Hungateiclostridiaceae bacterium KB18]ASB41676.1 adenylosuccinate synthase [Acutalibacter muris]MCI9192208.1 adenylosuccinate synthase [Acutalibacter muris]MCI9543474.1 adenylosuccinate synthase [Acutalibacter muris]QQR30938.1 adenylosuccinate synthase [Acutalibacter muris]
MVKAIVGACWGDEGKGKITDVLAEDSDIVIRFQGGSNAGHTIINEYGRFALHQLPSGVFRQNITNIIGNGVAFSVENFVKEMQYIRDGGVPEPRILISERCQVLMPYHKELDGLEEARLADKAYGSTKSGIAPFYSDKYAKIGFQISDLFDDKDAIYERIDHVLGLKNVLYRELYHKEPLNRDDIYNKLMEYKEIVAPYVADTTTLLYNAVKEGKTILLEGQLGSLRDPDMGIYPMTTSSSPLAGFGAVGAGGIPPYAIEKIYCVVKAYSSAVGAGEFVSEIFGDEAEELRKRGGDKGEYGATTGRPRQVGWLDLVAARYGCRVQGATDVALTVLDALGYLDEIPVCVAYELDGERIDSFPPTAKLKRCKPILEKLPGWRCDIKGIKRYEDLPENAKRYVEFAEKHLGVPVTMVSNGPAREDIMYR